MSQLPHFGDEVHEELGREALAFDQQYGSILLLSLERLRKGYLFSCCYFYHFQLVMPLDMPDRGYYCMPGSF